MLRAHLVREVKILDPLLRHIILGTMEHRLFIKIITRMDRKLRDESIKSN
jgi:hypothetical protein